MAAVSPTTISGIESGKITRPHLKTLLKIARALGTEVGELRESGKVEAPPSSTQPPLNGFEEEQREDRRATTVRDALENLRRTADRFEGYHAIQKALDEYQELWEKRLAEGDFDKAAIEEAGRALKAFWPAVTAAADAELVEGAQWGVQPEEAVEASVLLPAIQRFQALCDRVNRTYREKYAPRATVHAFPQRKAS